MEKRRTSALNPGGGPKGQEQVRSGWRPLVEKAWETRALCSRKELREQVGLERVQRPDLEGLVYQPQNGS